MLSHILLRRGMAESGLLPLVRDDPASVNNSNRNLLPKPLIPQSSAPVVIDLTAESEDEYTDAAQHDSDLEIVYVQEPSRQPEPGQSRDILAPSPSATISTVDSSDYLNSDSSDVRISLILIDIRV